MAETKFYISDGTDKRLREEAMKRFGYGKGSISKAAEEAVVQWLMKIDRINSRLNAILEKAKTDDSVIAIFLFGSFANKEPNFKDVDVAILFKDGVDCSGRIFSYAGVAGSVEDRIIDISAINQLPLYMQKKILNSGILIYSKNMNDVYDFSINELKRFDDFEPIYQVALKP